MDLNASRSYWDRVASEKRFHHKLRTDWLEAHVAGTHILDCGCGYGRVLSELVRAGYLGAVGTDFSAGMLARCAAVNPALASRLVQADSRSLPFQDTCFDAAIAFTLLTSMPDDSDQQALMREIRRVLRPGGWSMSAISFSTAILETLNDTISSRPSSAPSEYSSFPRV